MEKKIHWESDGKNDATVAILIDEVVVMADDAANKSNYFLIVTVVQVLPQDDFDIFFNMTNLTMVSIPISNDQIAKKKAYIKHEVHAYLIDTNNNTGDSRPL